VKTFFRGAVHGLPGADGVLTDGAVIAWAGQGSPPQRPDEEIVLADGELLAPGFIDLQVNGFGGRDAAEGRDAIAAISAALPATMCPSCAPSPPRASPPTPRNAPSPRPPLRLRTGGVSLA